MKQFVKKVIAEAIEENRKLFAVYLRNGNESYPLPDLEFIKTEFTPRTGEFIHLMKGDHLLVYEVKEVNHIYHYSSFEFQEGNIVVENTGRKIYF